MKINISKNDKGEIVFEFNDKVTIFNYESFDELINLTYDNDDKIEIIAEEEYKNYQSLLEEIISKSRTEDYRRAVKTAKENAEKLKVEDNNI